jgi:Zn-finger nucleic acid-binding protein
VTPELHCPHGGHGLSIRDIEGHVGYFCSECRGAWLPRNYLQSIGLERHFSVERFESLLAEQPLLPTELQCPKHCGDLKCCHIKGVDLDWCPVCRGVWFDRGEIAKLLAQYSGRKQKGDDGDSGLDAGDVFDAADLVSGLFELLN